MKDHKVVFIAMSGVRVVNQQLFDTGLTLPGFVDRSRVIASLPSLGLLTLAAHTPDNWEIIYKEFDYHTEEDISEVLGEEPDIIAFSSLTARIYETYELSRRFRNAGITVVLGGLHASAMPEEAREYVDVVVQGEGELCWGRLLQDYEAGALKSLYSSFADPSCVFDLRNARTPRYDLLDLDHYNRLTIQTTRGCPLHCSFCAASRTISTYKKKPIPLIRKELDAILELWDKPFIELADDNTFVDKKWSKELVRLFGEYKIPWFTETDISIAYDDELLELMAQANCLQVLIGFESVNVHSVKGLDTGWKYQYFNDNTMAIEKIQSFGISVNGCFVLGFDTDTKETFEKTKEFIVGCDLSDVQITLLTPFPGTDLYEQLKAEGRLLLDYWDKCTLFDVTFIPKNFTVQELENEFRHLMTSIYSDELVKKRKMKFRETRANRKKLLDVQLKQK